MRQPLRVVLSCTFVLLAVFGAPVARAGQVNLAWDPVAGATGYRVYYGSSSGQYSQSVTVGTATQATVSGLADCASYFFAVKAYNSAGESSSFSNEISGWSRPTVTAFTPSTVGQGDQMTLDVTGSNFQSGASLTWTVQGAPTSASGDDLVRIENIARISCTQMQALLTIEPTARGQRAMEVGSFSVAFEVVNPDQVFGQATRTLSVQFDEARADINQSDLSTRNRVDGRDLVWLARAYASSDGQAAFNPDSDLDGDGLIDGNDLAFLAARFGRCWSGTSWSPTPCN